MSVKDVCIDAIELKLGTSAREALDQIIEKVICIPANPIHAAK